MSLRVILAAAETIWLAVFISLFYLGLGLKKQLLVNMMVPMLIAYGRFTGNKKIAKSAYEFLATSSSESNNICASFNILGLKFDSALESQAAVELKKRYCQQFRCLECQFGKNLLNIY